LIRPARLLVHASIAAYNHQHDATAFNQTCRFSSRRYGLSDIRYPFVQEITERVPWDRFVWPLLMEIQYLNTDLEIESKNDLSKIVEEFGDDVLVQHHGEIRGYQHASFSSSGGSTDANATINYFCDLVESLPGEARRVWDGCFSRIFDVGYECGTSAETFRSEIRASTIARVSKVGASVVITIYPESEQS